MSERLEIKVYGASDDLVEVEGALREEFNPGFDDDEGGLLAFADGTVLRIGYSKTGVWRIVPVTGGSMELDIQQAPEDDEDNYSDVATLVGDQPEQVAWVVYGTQMAKRVVERG